MELIYTYKDGHMIFFEKMDGGGSGGFCNVVDKDYNPIFSSIFGHTKKVAIERARDAVKNRK